ncbi:MAG: HYR domain-containing protein, partial [Bacteroidales bacterium]
MIHKNLVTELLLGILKFPVVLVKEKSDTQDGDNKLNIIRQSMVRKCALIIMLLVSLYSLSSAATKTWVLAGAGAWDVGANWSGGTVPAPGDDVIINLTAAGIISNVPSISLNSLSIGGTADVTLTGTGTSLITINNINATVALNINGGRTLTLGAGTAATAVSITFQTITTATTLLGTLTNTANNTVTLNASQTLTIAGTFNANAGTIVINGTATTTGTGVLTGTLANLSFVSGSIYNHAGNAGVIPTANWNSNSVINVTGTTITAPTGFNQTFGTLNLNCGLLTGARTATLTGNVTIQGNLTISGTSVANTMTLNPAGFDFIVNGTTTINAFGIWNDNATAGTNRFDQLVTVNANGQFINTNAPPYEFRGGISNNGTFTVSGGGSTTFTTNAAQPISGSSVLTFGGDIILSDPASLNIADGISFSGTNLTNNSNTAIAFNATAGTFTFARLGAQNINGAGTGSIAFYNLTAGGNGTKTANLPFNVNNSLSINSGVILSLGTTPKTINVVGDMTIGGSLDFGTVAAKTVNVTGNLINVAGVITMTGAGLAHNLNLGGVNNAITTLNTTAGSGSIINYNRVGDQQIFGNNNYQNITLSGGGTKSLQGNATIINIVNLTNGVLRLGANNLTISNNAINAIQGTFSSSNMIETNGTGYLIKNAIATLPISFPLGSGGYYSPMSITATSTTTGTINVRAVPSALGSNYLDKYWDVITTTGGKTITATFNYDPAEISIAPSTIWYKPGAGNWLTPTGTSSFGVSSFTITGTTTMTTTSTWWTAGALLTYYSYQTGDWNTPNTWTSDPSGTLQVGNSVPGLNDKVEILTGRTVSLSSDIATQGLDITIDGGGFLDQTTYKFASTLTALRGQGTLKLASVNFPAATINSFINTGGGTTEYNNSANFTLPAAQATYNNLTINAPGFTATQLSNLILNGNLYVKNGVFRINDNASAVPLSLTINGNVSVDNSGSILVGDGATNPDISAVTIGGVAPFINYYTYFHTVIIKGDFTNNGTVRFTNLLYPIYNAFPSTVADPTTGAASVYFQGATDNTLTCNGVTDFYNLILDKGTDQTYKLTINSTAYSNFRIFGANTLTGETAGSNANLRKALWIRTGTLLLQGSVAIPSLTEGVTGGSPNSDFYIPSNGALVLNGVDVVVLSTADNYQEVNVAYNVSATDNSTIGISTGGNSAIDVYGKLQINNGYFSTRESGGIITSNVASGQLVINGGIFDTKQLLSSTGAAQYTQTGGTFILRGRFQRTPVSYATVSNLADVSAATLNTSRAVNGISSGFGTFNLENTSNIFSVSGGTIIIYDVSGVAAGEEKAFDVKSSSANINVSGGTLEIIPVTGSVLADAINYSVYTNASINNFIIDRTSSTSIVNLSTPLIVLNNLSVTSGDFNANNFDVSVGGNFTLENGTTYTPGTNTTTLNGTADQLFTINLSAALSLNKFTINKPAGVNVNLAGSQNAINVNDNFRLVLGTLNDNGKIITASKDVYNSGLYSGAGKIVLNGTITQSIDGNGIFGNVELNNTNAAAAPVSLAANMTVNGDLTFSQAKLFNINIYNLKLNAAASIVNASATRYIQTSGNGGDGGLTKVYSTPAAFTFPVGAPTITPARPVKYTPATIGFSIPPAVYGSITVIPVGYEHPTTTIKGQSLTYFWRIKSSGFSGIAANSVTHSFTYDQSDVVGTEANYIPALYTSTDFTWRKGTNSNPPINTATNTFIDWTTPTNSADFLDADYTAGDNAFGTPLTFYSIANSAWNLNSTWSYTSGGPAVPAGAVEGVNFPGPNSVVIIENNHTVNLTANQRCASLQIQSGSVLDIYTWTGSTFSIVLSYPSGTNGLFRLTTTVGSPKVFSFPANSDFSDFNNNHGTTEFYDIDGATGAEYILPPNVTTYGNLILTAKGGDNLILPNNSGTTIKGDLTVTGDNPDAWVTMSWLTGVVYSPTIEKTVHVTGNMYINNGTFLFLDDQTPQHLVVDGNVTIASGAVFDVYNNYPVNNGAAPRLNSFAIGGNFINNSNVNPSARFINGNNYVNLTFSGSANALVTSTGGATPNTIFNNVIVNKGSSQATTLTFNIAGTLTTPLDNWLTLQNGTLIYNRTGVFNISQGTDFTIPATAGLTLNTSSNVFIANIAANGKTLFLNGKLTLLPGGENVYLGPIGNTTNNADIEYSGSGASAIEVQGGALIVNGQIRRPIATTNGILSYKQTGGAVTINGNNTNVTKAKLEILNDGSDFTMSGGTLTIVKGGGTTFGDLYLRPSTSSVTGGTILFAHNIAGVNQSYGLEANVPLYNLTITGRTVAAAANATVGLMVSPLVLNGTLTLSNIRSFLNSNNINVSIQGDMNNSGTYNYGTNLTTFNGGVQSITGASVTNFYDLNVSPATSLTVNNDFTVNRNLTISNGNLVLVSKKVTLLGDLDNEGSYTDDNTTGGVSLSGSAQQQITGEGAYGRLTINNLTGAKLNNDITLQNDLVFTQGVLDISNYLLTLSQNSSIGGAPFSASKMIKSDGVISSQGVRKYFTAAPQSFTFPIGVFGKYTPALYTITASASVGYIRVNPINTYQPSVTDPTNVLQYYWHIESSGISGFNSTLLLQYLPVDVQGVESNYVAAKLNLPGNYWTKAPVGSGTDNVNETTHQITFIDVASSNLNGEYTAGNDGAIPGEVPEYQSNQDGNWSDPTIWTPMGSSPPCPSGGPNGANVIIDNVVTVDINNIFAFSTLINNKLRIVSPTFGHNLGVVTGNGTIYLENGNLPGGDFSAFIDCSGNGTIEYGGTGNYTIIATQFSSLPNMFATGTGTRVLPNKDLTICKRLVIDGPILDNSVNNKKLTILGTMERYNTGVFNSGSGASPAATVSFAGSALQSIGGPTGDFSGASMLNNLEINNPAGLNIGTNGSVEVNNVLMLTNGIIGTSSSNKLTLLNTSSTAVSPSGGSATSFVNGPLIKYIINGDVFLYPIGNGTVKGHNFTLTSTAGSTLAWTAEYFTPNPTSTSLAPPLLVTNTKEYWGVNTTTGSTAKVKLGWDPLSDLTPLMTVNGISDMRVAQSIAGLWTELASTTSGDNSNGDVASTNNINISTIPQNFTTASVTTTVPRATLAPTGPVCGNAGIPVNFTSFFPINLNYTLDYKINGVAQPTANVTSLPYYLPTLVPGAYQLTGFTYNNGANTGVVDGTIVNAYANPTAANAGLDQSLCGVSGLVLAANSPIPYSGLWTIVSGAGGTFVNSTQNNTVFTGVLGETYTLRWTISNASCTSSDDVVISFPVVASMPANFTSAPTQVCQGSSGYVYTVPNVAGNTYNWSYTGSGQTINGTGNSVTIDFSITATSGTLNVTATNSCGTSAPRSIAITVNTLPAPSIIGNNTVCPNSSGIIYSTTNNPGDNYSWVVSGGVINGSSTGNSIVVKWGSIGSGTVKVTESNPITGCTFTTPNYNVTINDILPPVISNCPANIFVNNDPGLCSAVVTWIEPTATDDCTPSGSLIWTKSNLPGSTFPSGTTPVTYTATDASGNTSLACTFIVTVTDNTSPVITLPAPPTINADATCHAIMPVIAATATDNCSIPANITITQLPAAGSIIGTGVTSVTITATDQSGNSAVATINVTVVDVTPPLAICKNITVVLDATGNASIVPADINNGSSDNCGIASMSISKSSFTCADQGIVPVTLTVFDNSGNSSSCISNVNVTSSLKITSIALSTCDVAPPFALFSSTVSGGSGTYTYFWKCLESTAYPFMYMDALPPFLHFTKTSTAAFPFFNSTMPNGTYHIRLVVTDGNGCKDSSDMVLNQGSVTFNNVTLLYSDACEGETKTYSVNFDAAATYTWNVANGIFLTPNNTNTVDVRWNLGATQGVVTANVTKPDINGNACGSSTVDSVSIHPTPSPGFIAPVVSVCAGSTVTYTLSPPLYSNYTWTVTNGTIVVGGTPSSDFVTVLWGTNSSGSVAVNVTTSHGCTASTSLNVDIYNVSGSVTSQTNESCTGNGDGSVTVEATVGTGLAPYQYSIDGGATWFSPPFNTFNSLSAGSYTVIIKDALGCTFNVPVLITVTPNNTVNRTSPVGTDAQTVCINTAITSITYATTGATGATVTGLPAGVAGVWAANVVTISGTPTAAGPFTYTVTLTGGCGAVTTTGTITVTPNNTVTRTSPVGTDAQTVCINTAITSITYATTGATGATVTGLPAGVTGVWAANVVTISGTPTASGPFTYTVTLTGGCGAVTETGTITVTPNNTVTRTSPVGTDAQTVCINTSITSITYATTGATGATVTGLPAGVAGVWAANVVTISGTPTAAGPFTYTVTLTGGCGAVTTTGTITVTPNNTVTRTSPVGTDAQTVCINTAITSITYATTGATGATVTGLPAGVTGVWAANVVTISGTPTASGPFTYTVTLTGGCGAVTATGTITVTPNNTVSLTSPVGTDAQTVCINTAITSITYATTGATGATVTGLPAG